MADYASEWRVIGASVQGTSHARKCLPNQDALRWFPEFGRSDALFLAVADGHGGGLSFRSSTGSELAVQAAQTAFMPFITALQDMPEDEIDRHSSRIKFEAENTLPRTIHQTWRRMVEQHWHAAPPVKAEVERLATRSGRHKVDRLASPDGFYTAYGATLLAALVTPKFLIYLQLGDGDILTIDHAGLPGRIFDPDVRCMANETTSLCQDSAVEDMQVKFRFLEAASDAPALVLLSTDGFKNSFESENDYRAFGTDLHQRLDQGSRENEIRSASSALTDWLMEITRSGSGDDVTLGILIRTDAFTPHPAVLLAEGEQAA